MTKLSSFERSDVRAWCVNYAVQINTARNVFGIELCAPVERVLIDAQKIFEFIIDDGESRVVGIKE